MVHKGKHLLSHLIAMTLEYESLSSNFNDVNHAMKLL